MRKLSVTLLVSTLLTLPLLASAQGGAGQLTVFENMVRSIRVIVDLLIPILFGIAIIAFFYGLVKFLFADADESKTAGKRIMLWGVIAIAVMATLYGLIGFLRTTFGISDSATITLPKLPN